MHPVWGGQSDGAFYDIRLSSCVPFTALVKELLGVYLSHHKYAVSIATVSRGHVPVLNMKMCLTSCRDFSQVHGLSRYKQNTF